MNIFILGFNNAYASSLAELMDIFHQADQLIDRQSPSEESLKINVKLVSMDGKPVLCQKNILFNVDCSIADIKKPDIVMVTSIHDIDSFLASDRFLAKWLKKQYDEGATIAGICTGNFLLAEAGLLDGKEATTHWSASAQFKARYPKVKLKPEKLISNHGNLYCSSGKGSATDLVYFLLEKDFGHGLASRTAKFFVHDCRQIPQNADSVDKPVLQRGDSSILKAQEWICRHLSENLTISRLSDISCMSRRTFERRFKSATGDPPRVYIQRLRVEAAKHRLETTDLSFDEISYGLGYQNSGSLRKIFFNRVNLLPSEYRKRFKAYPHND